MDISGGLLRCWMICMVETVKLALYYEKVGFDETGLYYDDAGISFMKLHSLSFEVQEDCKYPIHLNLKDTQCYI